MKVSRPLKRPNWQRLLAILVVAISLWAVFNSQPRLYTAIAQGRRRNCQLPDLHEDEGRVLGCSVLRKACIDHSRIILHSGQRTPGHPNYTDDPLFPLTIKQITLPGYEEPLGTAFFMTCTDMTKCTLQVRPPTPLDPPDISKPKSWDACTVPFIFSAPYFGNFAELFLTGVAAIYHMHESDVVSEATQFVPYTGGMAAPPFYANLLKPFSPKGVISLDELSSRERLGSRCYEAIQVCQPPGLTYSSQDPVSGIGIGVSQLEFKHAGRFIMDYYKERNKVKFEAKQAPEETFVVTFAIRTDYRIILNFDEILEKCKAWKPPKGSVFKKTRCMTMQPTADSFIEDLAKVDASHALVGPHGAAGTFGLFLNEGAAHVEIVSWDFCGIWPTFYFRERIETDETIKTGHFKIKAGPDFIEPGPFEANGTGSSVAYARDRNIRLDWGTLAKVLERIALGDIESTLENRPSRIYKFGDQPECPVKEDEGKR